MTDLLFQGIQRRLLAKVTQAKAVEYFLDQYNESEDQRVFTTPSLYLEFAPIEFRTLTQNIQQAELTFMVHTVHESAYDDENRILSADGLLNFLGVQTEVYKALMNWRLRASYLSGDNADTRTLMESVVRTRSVPDHAMSRLMVNTQTFRAVVYDYSAVKNMTPVQVSPVVAAELVPKIT